MELRQSYIITGSGSAPFDKAIELAREAVGSTKAQHPDIIVVRKGEGKAKNEISVDQVREVIASSIVLPNQSDHKVYIFADGGSMNASAQNAALKLIEEPPAGVIIILCAPQADLFLPTVRSRCVELCLNGEEAGPEDPLAPEFMKVFANGSKLERFNWIEGHNKMSIAEASDFCAACRKVVLSMLTGRKSCGKLSTEELLALDETLEKCIEYLSVNVTVKQVFGLLEII